MGSTDFTQGLGGLELLKHVFLYFCFSTGTADGTATAGFNPDGRDFCFSTL
jgi:hypothetical protein